MWTCSICKHKFDKSDMDMDERTCHRCLYKETHKNCACHKQIIWYFDKPTIVACINCERTFYHDVVNCPECDEKITYFVKEE